VTISSSRFIALRSRLEPHVDRSWLVRENRPEVVSSRSPLRFPYYSLTLVCKEQRRSQVFKPGKSDVLKAALRHDTVRRAIEVSGGMSIADLKGPA